MTSATRDKAIAALVFARNHWREWRMHDKADEYQRALDELMEMEMQ